MELAGPRPVCLPRRSSGSPDPAQRGSRPPAGGPPPCPPPPGPTPPPPARDLLRARFQLFDHQVERARDDRRLTLEPHPVANIDHHHVLPAIELGLQLFRRDSRDPDPPQKPLPRDVDPPPHRLVPKGLKPERLELGGRQRDTRDGGNPAPRESLPRPFDLRNRDPGLRHESRE